ncbi:sugar O-acetyltransferase, partial [Pseudostreptobacillus hongkongensis]|uniref:sugar O-acetyltransferase n=1 Tax=Pseudostreptobacillus hongkongensis TaxID=1162717 RepID=UPI0028D56222
KINMLDPYSEERSNLLKVLFPNIGENVTILSNFNIDYGYLTFIGDNVFINHVAYFMDGGKIFIGSNCFIGPNCGMYTANHPLIAKERNMGLEMAKSIVIEENVWIGADVTILPGVKIGKNSVIGAKSLVTKDIPENVIAMGHPCKVIREIKEFDTIQKETETN